MKQNLSDKLIQTIKTTTSDRIQLYDQKISGLVLRVTASGVKSFSYVYRLPDSHIKKRFHIGKYPAIGLAEARSIALDASNKVMKGLDPAKTKQENKTAPTFKEFFEVYNVQHLNNLRTANEQYRLLMRDAIPAWGNRKIITITRQDVCNLLDTIRSSNTRKSPIVANRLLQRLKHLFNVARNHGLIEKSPAEGIKNTKESSRDRVLQNEEIKKFWKGVERVGLSFQIISALKLVLLTGQRSGEIINMHWDEINWDNKTWTIPADKAKNGEEHTIPLTSMVISLLEKAKSQAGNSVYVFPSSDLKDAINDLPMRRTSVGRAVQRKYETWGIAQFTPHDLRRTARTKLAELGVSDVVAERILNHKQQGVQAIYNRHRYTKEMREALELWETALIEIVSREHCEGEYWETTIDEIKQMQKIKGLKKLLSDYSKIDENNDDLLKALATKLLSSEAYLRERS